MLRDPSTVLECCRQFQTLQDVIGYLFRSGSPFYTFVPQNRIPQPLPLRLVDSPNLGVFPKHYKPGLRQYRHYEDLRREFCALPRARAALTRGGLIWRLAVDSVGEPAQDIVKNGPSREVHTHGTSLTNQRTATVLLDDELTKAEKDFMCGVYQVFTGE